MKNNNNIEKLLLKYWDGLSTIREERILKDFFKKQQKDMPEHQQEWFGTISQLSGEKSNLPLPKNDSNPANNKGGMVRLKIRPKAAAVVIIILGLTAIAYKYHIHYKTAKNIELSKKAEQELLSISKSLQRGDQVFRESVEQISNHK